jgi:pimeloyl-ACP methyl ester carboxylesterase
MLTLLLFAAVLAGCGEDTAIYMTDARKASGLVIILPGIEGESEMNHGIREGLMEGGVEYALDIHSWGVPVPGLGMVVNQTNFLGNRLAGMGVAKKIADYQNAHPGKPVYVVGHSGGGGVAVFTAEALADMEGDHHVDGLILLSASISGDYNLTKALGRSRKGLVNFYNTQDTALLGLGTGLLGNVDGGHAPSAGRVGFEKTFPRVYEVSIESSDDPHASATRPSYAAAFVAPWVRAQTWPAAATSKVGGSR